VHRPLHEHILLLEDKLQDLREKLTQNNLPASARDAMLVQVRIANDALNHFRRAVELEYALNTGDTTPLTRQSHPHPLDISPKSNPRESETD
jgi:hypothetical protein